MLEGHKIDHKWMIFVAKTEKIVYDAGMSRLPCGRPCASEYVSFYNGARPLQ
jgi:hypothetical protein